MRGKRMVPLLDLKAQYNAIKRELDEAVQSVLESQVFILGKKVEECEAAIAAYSQCRHGCGVSSGTDALLIALMAEQVQPGDEIITTPYTFFATAGSIARLGAKPVFVDICPRTFNICPKAIETAITARTRGIMPVHLYGQMADMKPIMELARKHHLFVIEDAAQAIGSESEAGKAGSVGDYGCFSFFPSKNLGGIGDGGMVVTNDDEKIERLRVLRNHGSKPKYYHKLVGGNFRLDAIQAAVVHVKLPHLNGWSGQRQKNAVRYDRLFAEAGLSPEHIITPQHTYDESSAGKGDFRHIFNQYCIITDQRDALLEHLKKANIGTEIYYPVPMHLQECFAYLGYKKGAMPNSESAATRSMALPIYPELTDDQAIEVVDTIASFFKKTA